MCDKNKPTNCFYIYNMYLQIPLRVIFHFIKGIDTVLNRLYKPNMEINICGDMNINYLEENCNKRQQLDALLATCNLISTI